ncbi:hypothetical protein GON03_13600 [Nocardioides sp. MAH-18]|uniref:Uncharacterized protein n=1 Tax=Nocardioides agri TaxID=2682843 RepID=A0A6L6XUA5_9ACTN|nr:MULTISPECIES: hypothetical protein [unclassified Nocardioides]MBA2955366.1 hypothetical protein [Nocardioides sp. CGMCC 1.13656]MVQ50217.1 hypothetical protein [Nocardioides sp. MAH-18]
MHLRTALVALVLVAASLVALPAAASAAPEAAVASAEGGAAARSDTHADDARVLAFPSLAQIRWCTASMGRIAGCAATAFESYCLGTYSKILGCLRKVKSAYETYQTIVAFQQSDRCPTVLGSLAQYLCRPTVPPAPRVVVATVVTVSGTLRAHTGPYTWFTYSGYYVNGNRLGVVCAIRFGERVYDGARSSTWWMRLANGLYVPAIGLQWPGEVPWC